jgi:hypothetical protein
MVVEVTYIDEVGGTIAHVEFHSNPTYDSIRSSKTWHKGYVVEGKVLYLDMDREFVEDLLYMTMVTDIHNYLVGKKV